MNDLSGGCHCGRIRYRYNSPLPPEGIQPRACRCDFCRRIGGTYTSHSEGVLSAELPNRSQPYKFGTETADFWVCGRCGNTPFVTCEIEGHRYAVLNVNTLENFTIDPDRLTVSDFEGETPAMRLSRRAERWIGNVALRFYALPESEEVKAET